MLFFERYSQNSQENNCVRDSILRKGCWKETPAQVFSYEFCEISKNTFFTKHLRTTASIRVRPFIIRFPSTKLFKQTYVRLPGWKSTLSFPVKCVQSNIFCFVWSAVNSCNFKSLDFCKSLQSLSLLLERTQYLLLLLLSISP